MVAALQIQVVRGEIVGRAAATRRATVRSPSSGSSFVGRSPPRRAPGRQTDRRASRRPTRTRGSSRWRRRRAAPSRAARSPARRTLPPTISAASVAVAVVIAPCSSDGEHAQRRKPREAMDDLRRGRRGRNTRGRRRAVIGKRQYGDRVAADQRRAERPLDQHRRRRAA